MYPSIISTFNIVSPTDRLNSPSHSALHNSVSSVLTQVQTVVGLSTSSAVGTLMYDVRSPDSNGGGHVQTANKGGTGQTSFTKGDLLVATSSSVIAKLAVSSVLNDILVSDPSQSAGIKWATNPSSNKIAVSSVTTTVGSSTAETTLLTASILAGTLSTNNAVRFSAFMINGGFNNSGGETITFRARYGTSIVSTATIAPPDTDITGVGGFVTGMIIGNGATTSQKTGISVDLHGSDSENDGQLAVGVSKIVGYGSSIVSINSATDQQFSLTVQFSQNDAATTMTTVFGTIEKIT